MSSIAPSRSLTPNQQARRTRILDAARHLVALHGYDGMIMRDVANAAGVSPTTLYNLYNTKDELLLEALRESVADGWNKSIRDVPEPGLDRLLAQIKHSVQETRDEPEFARAITLALMRASKGDQISDVLIDGSCRGVEVSLDAMAASGELAQGVAIDSLARALVGGFWMNYLYWSNGYLDLDQLENELNRVYLSYLLAETTGSTRDRIDKHIRSL